MKYWLGQVKSVLDNCLILLEMEEHRVLIKYRLLKRTKYK